MRGVCPSQQRLPDLRDRRVGRQPRLCWCCRGGITNSKYPISIAQVPWNWFAAFYAYWMNFFLCNLGKRYGIPKKIVKFWWPFFCTKTSWTAMKHVTNEGGGHIWFHHSKNPKRWIQSVLGLSNPADQKRDNKFLNVSRGGGGQWFRNNSFTVSLYLL